MALIVILDKIQNYTHGWVLWSTILPVVCESLETTVKNKFTTIQIPLDSGIMERLKSFRDTVETESQIPGVKVSLYAALDIAVKEATQTRKKKAKR